MLWHCLTMQSKRRGVEDNMKDTDVTIIGCGPIGALMANLLGARGIRTLVLDKETEIYQLPRAVGMDDEIRRVLQSQELDGAYKENVTTLQGMDLLRRNRRRLRRFDLCGEVEVLGHPIFTLFHQPSLEKEIRQGLTRYTDSVDLRLGEEVRSIQDHGDHLDITFANTETGSEETVRTRYVLGCDGGRSYVRKSFSLEQHDLDLHQPWVVVDVIMKRPIESSGYAEQICDPARPSTFIPSPPPRKRWEFMVMPGDDPEQLTTPEFLNELIRPWAPPEDYDVERAAIYTFHALITKQWRTGRSGNVMLLGDAAHQMPPFLGQGMCAGIRDAFNLAWKLDLVLGGRADAKLLDTYQSERAEHVRKVIELAVQIGNLIQSSSRVKTFFVNMTMVLGEKFGTQQQAKTMKTIPLGPGFYSLSHAPERRSRCPFPQPRVETPGGSACLLDDCLGENFTLLSRSKSSAGSNDGEQDSLIQEIRFSPPGSADANGAGASIVDTEGVLGEWLDKRSGDAVLLRPDRQPFGLYEGECATLAYVRDDLKNALNRKSQVETAVAAS